ncbi:MAG: HlyD family type I secretion periplasmic adaptor subunit [Pseudomonadota bacterium]
MSRSTPKALAPKALALMVRRSGAIVRRSGADDPLLPAILEFQRPSAAIVNASVPRSARSVVWIIASMVFVLIAAMGLIPVDQVVTARGVVVSELPTILVQPLETAIVRSIDVREGQRVRAGDLLARLDPTFASADVATLAAQVSSLEAEVARLQAEAEGKAFNYTGTDSNWTLQAAIYGHRKAQFDAKLDNYGHRIEELAATMARSRSDADAYRERLGFAQTVEQMRKQLEAMQAGSKLNTLLAMDSRVEMERSMANAEQAVEAAKRDQAALAAERDAFVRGWRADVSQRISETIGKAKDAREQLNKANLRKELVELRSETDAIVQSVAKVSVGSVMQSGQSFISLVPAHAALEVEANISGRDNGFVHVQDPVAIKFDTFPYTQYGMAEGVVRTISPDSFTAQSEARNPTSAVPVAAAASEPFYRSRITLDRVALHDVPAGFRIIPGMPVAADIKVGKRTVLGYLLGLMLPVAQEAMREP